MNKSIKLRKIILVILILNLIFIVFSSVKFYVEAKRFNESEQIKRQERREELTREYEEKYENEERILKKIALYEISSGPYKSKSLSYANLFTLIVLHIISIIIIAKNLKDIDKTDEKKLKRLDKTNIVLIITLSLIMSMIASCIIAILIGGTAFFLIYFAIISFLFIFLNFILAGNVKDKFLINAILFLLLCIIFSFKSGMFTEYYSYGGDGEMQVSNIYNIKLFNHIYYARRDEPESALLLEMITDIKREKMLIVLVFISAILKY